MIPGRRPTFSDSGGMAVPPFELESQVCRPTVTLSGTSRSWDRFMPAKPAASKILSAPPGSAQDPPAPSQGDGRLGSGPRRGAESGCRRAASRERAHWQRKPREGRVRRRSDLRIKLNRLSIRRTPWNPNVPLVHWATRRIMMARLLHYLVVTKSCPEGARLAGQPRRRRGERAPDPT
jgi:hypothetical protein